MSVRTFHAAQEGQRCYPVRRSRGGAGGQELPSATCVFTPLSTPHEKKNKRKSLPTQPFFRLISFYVLHVSGSMPPFPALRRQDTSGSSTAPPSASIPVLLFLHHPQHSIILPLTAAPGINANRACVPYTKDRRIRG